MLNAKINNLKDYALNHKYIVARIVGDELWFWGAWDDMPKAEKVAHELGNAVVVANTFFKNF